MFNTGDKVELKNGGAAVIKRFLGQGGQGAVYEVEYEGMPYALKWYLPEYLKKIDQKSFYNNILSNIDSGPPADEFLWPVSISEYSENSFGYIMNIRPDNYKSFTSVLNATSKIKSLKTQLCIAEKICKAFQKLHSLGYSYQDINDGNFFVDTNDGGVLICDNDNVAPCGVWMGMAGKDRYMAPEVVMGKKHAGMESDLYSLAVVLFMLLFIAHPLEGRLIHSCPCITIKLVRRFYAEHPVFVMDPKDQSNRPVMGIDNNIISRWPCYPKAIQNLFIRSFTDGLHDASYRVRENEWIDCIDKMIDSIVVCPMCGGEQFYNNPQNSENYFHCEDCGSKIRKPFIFSFGSKKKCLNLGSEIYSGEIEGVEGGIVGEVIESVKHKGLWGLKNLSDDIWKARFTNGKEKEYEKGRTVPLFKDTEIIMENKTIRIEM